MIHSRWSGEAVGCRWASLDTPGWASRTTTSHPRAATPALSGGYRETGSCSPTAAAASPARWASSPATTSSLWSRGPEQLHEMGHGAVEGRSGSASRTSSADAPPPPRERRKTETADDPHPRTHPGRRPRRRHDAEAEARQRLGGQHRDLRCGQPRPWLQRMDGATLMSAPSPREGTHLRAPAASRAGPSRLWLSTWPLRRAGDAGGCRSKAASRWWSMAG